MSGDDNKSGMSDLLGRAQDAVGAMVGMASASTLGANNADAFVKNAAISDLYEVEAGRIAERRAVAPEVRSFASMLVQDHSRSSEILAAKAMAAGVQPAAELDERRKGMLDNLQTASDDEFDSVFIRQQTAAHQEAVPCTADMRSTGTTTCFAASPRR